MKVLLKFSIIILYTWFKRDLKFPLNCHNISGSRHAWVYAMANFEKIVADNYWMGKMRGRLKNVSSCPKGGGDQQVYTYKEGAWQVYPYFLTICASKSYFCELRAHNTLILQFQDFRNKSCFFLGYFGALRAYFTVTDNLETKLLDSLWNRFHHPIIRCNV